MAEISASTITREQLIDPDYVKIAIENSTTMVRFENGEMQEIPLPESCKETLTLPEGYAVGAWMMPCKHPFPAQSRLDFLFDPITAIAAFARAGYTSLECAKYCLSALRDRS